MQNYDNILFTLQNKYNLESMNIALFDSKIRGVLKTQNLFLIIFLVLANRGYIVKKRHKNKN